MISGYLLTTCNLRTDGTADLLKLIASVDQALQSGEVERLRQVVLLQCCGEAERLELAKKLPDRVELISTEDRLSSPEARNVLIRHVLREDDFGSAFIGFPDDDVWYPRGALACIAREFASDPELQFLHCHYGPDASALDCPASVRPTLQTVLSHSGCAVLFVRGSLLAQLGGFHELLGLGTPISGGEDTEFAIRAFHAAKARTRYMPAQLVGHLAADRRKKAAYYEGGLTALLAHGGASPAAALALIRKLMVGPLLVARGYLSIGAYGSAIRRAFEHAGAVRRGPADTRQPKR